MMSPLLHMCNGLASPADAACRFDENSNVLSYKDKVDVDL